MCHPDLVTPYRCLRVRSVLSVFPQWIVDTRRLRECPLQLRRLNPIIFIPMVRQKVSKQDGPPIGLAPLKRPIT